MNNGSKVSDQQFLSILRENAGLYAKTAKAITKKFKVPYSRQAVRDRASTFKEDLEDIKEENLDIAEEGLHSLMVSKNEHIKLKAVEIYLKTIGKKRGYVERQEITPTDQDGNALQPIININVVSNKEEQ